MFNCWSCAKCLFLSTITMVISLSSTLNLFFVYYFPWTRMWRQHRESSPPSHIAGRRQCSHHCAIPAPPIWTTILTFFQTKSSIIYFSNVANVPKINDSNVCLFLFFFIFLFLFAIDYIKQYLYNTYSKLIQSYLFYCLQWVTYNILTVHDLQYTYITILTLRYSHYDTHITILTLRYSHYDTYITILTLRYLHYDTHITILILKELTVRC